MAEYKTHVGLADNHAGDHGATPVPGSQPRPAAGAPAAQAAPGAGSDKQHKGAGQGGGEVFGNFTPNTDAVLPEPTIQSGLDAAQDELQRGTEQAEAGPDKTEGAGSAPPSMGNAKGLWIALGLTALVIGALVLRPRGRRA
jgi:hypothetical protein